MKRIANIFTPNHRRNEDPARPIREQRGSAHAPASAGPSTQNGQREQPLSQVCASVPGAIANQSALVRTLRQFDLRAQNRAEARQQNDALQRLRRRNPQLAISDLRIGNESDIDLLSVPTENDVAPVRVLTDPQTNALTGRAYLEFLATDLRLGRLTRLFVNNLNVLTDPSTSVAKLQHTGERLRPVMARANIDAEFRTRIERICDGAANLCGDRVEHSIGEMQNAAILLNLESGEVDETGLYNSGIGFYKLDELHFEVGSRLPKNVRLDQSVHDYLNAQYCLQDEFQLPVRHERPIYINDNVSVITPKIAKEIGDKMRAKIPLGDYERAFEFMGKWEPWVKHSKRTEQLGPKFEMIENNYRFLMEQLEDEKDNPDLQMTDERYMHEANGLMRKLKEWEGVIAGQYAKEFLMNVRANMKIDAGDSPDFFANVR